MRRRWTRRGAALALCLAVPASLAACGSASSSGTGHLVVYSGQHVQTSAALVAAFEQKTGISVAVRSADESVLANQLIAEGSRSPADVFYAENSPALEAVASHGLLAPVRPSTLAQVPASASSPRGLWVGVTARITMMAYNTSRLKPSELPHSILELALPKWKGKLGLAPSCLLYTSDAADE